MSTFVVARRRYALPRPEGQRCLVVAARGQTVARTRNGALLERFGSPLPAGGRGQPAGDDNFCILDCVFHEPDQTYYVLGERGPLLGMFCAPDILCAGCGGSPARGVFCPLASIWVLLCYALSSAGNGTLHHNGARTLEPSPIPSPTHPPHPCSHTLTRPMPLQT